MTPSPSLEMAIHPATFRHMIADLTHRLPREGCGILMGNNALCTKYIAIQNIAPNPRQSWEMDTEEFGWHLQVHLREGYDLYALVHSHLNGSVNPSPQDLRDYKDWISDRGEEVVNIIVAWARRDKNKPIALGWKFPDETIALIQSQVGLASS